MYYAQADREENNPCIAEDVAKLDVIEVPQDDREIRTIKIGLFRAPRDWTAVHELDFRCETDGRINLEKVKREFGVEGICRVCSCSCFLDYSLTKTLDN